jgi:hypothetical protein
MKTILKLILISCFACSSGNNLQNREDCPNYWDRNLKIKIYTFVDRMPEYPNGQTEFLNFFASNFKVPDGLQFQGSMNLEIILGSNGELLNTGIKNKKFSSLTLIEKEALRVVRAMPNWNPGKCNGKNVPVKKFIPLNF